MSKDRRVLISAFLIVSAAYATLYTVAAHDLARWGWTCRGTLGDATFLPFPTGPQGVLMDVMAKMSPSDEFIYAHLIKTGALVGISILLWILAAIYLLKVVLPLFWKPSLPRQSTYYIFQRHPICPRYAPAPLTPKTLLSEGRLLGRISSPFEQLLDGSV